MQDDTTDKLHLEVLHTAFHAVFRIVLKIKYTMSRLTYNSIGFWQNIVQGLTLRQSLFKLIRFGPKLLIGKLKHSRSHALDKIHYGLYPSKLPLTMGAKHLCENTHLVCYSFTPRLPLCGPSPPPGEGFFSQYIQTAPL